MRDNIVNHKGVSYDAKTKLQAVGRCQPHMDDKLNVKMDFVGRMECIQSDFSHVAEKIDSPAQLVRTNVGSHDNYRDYYNAETKKIVADVYEKDIALFGYQFDSGR